MKKIITFSILLIIMFLDSNVFASTIISDEFSIDDTKKIIYNVDANISREVFEKKITCSPDCIIVDYKNNPLETDSIIKTGNVISFDNGDIYKISVLGDVTADDGLANLDDAKKMAQYIIDEKNALMNSYEYFLAADYNGDGVVKINDILYMMKNPKIYLSTNKRSVNYDVDSNSEDAIKIFASSSTGETPLLSVDNPLIANIDQNGVINPRRTGRVKVMASVENGKKEMSFVINGERIHFINLGQSGNAFLLESDGKFALYDAGKSVNGELLSYIKDRYGIEELEFILLSHPHVDHYGDIESILKSGITVKKIYRKHYLNTDAACAKNENSECYDYNYLNNIGNFSDLKELVSTDSIYYNQRYFDKVAIDNGTEVIYVDDDVNAYENKAAIVLGNMQLVLYNVKQRMISEKNSNDSFDYDSSSYWASKGENVNSILALVRVNGHNALLTGDEEHDGILSFVLDKVYSLLEQDNQKLDIFNIPHHANYNCVNEGMRIGTTGYLSNVNNEIKAKDLVEDIGKLPYYVASMPSDAISWQYDENHNIKYDENGEELGYFRIANEEVAEGKEGTTKGCLYKLGISMFDVYYTADATYSSGNKGAVIANLNNKDVTLSYGFQKSCRYPSNGDVYIYSEAKLYCENYVTSME